jgi:hypothetical protein
MPVSARAADLVELSVRMGDVQQRRRPAVMITAEHFTKHMTNGGATSREISAALRIVSQKPRLHHLPVFFAIFACQYFAMVKVRHFF